MNNEQLLVKVTQANDTISASAGAYGTSAAQDTALAAAEALLSAGITAAENARTASKAATQQLETARAAALEILGSVGGTIYYNPDVSNQMLADAGYTIHDPVPTKHSPTQPLDLTATPDAYGTVAFNFHNNGNPYPTTYIIEGRPSENVDWTTIITTTRTRLKVEGFAPGITHWFRVRASRLGQTSIPSNVAAIWEPEGVVLEIAA
ncbi:MAG: hypothetical protein WD716_08180 [Fimbriimonadaceae bacterium]